MQQFSVINTLIRHNTKVWIPFMPNIFLSSNTVIAYSPVHLMTGLLVSSQLAWYIEPSCDITSITHIRRMQYQQQMWVYDWRDIMMTSSNWKHFPRYWPFVLGTHRSPVNSLHKGQWGGALIFSLICAWINGWVHSRETGDLRHNCLHYDATVMNTTALDWQGLVGIIAKTSIQHVSVINKYISDSPKVCIFSMSTYTFQTILWTLIILCIRQATGLLVSNGLAW